jgi:hypothetical protein
MEPSLEATVTAARLTRGIMTATFRILGVLSIVGASLGGTGFRDRGVLLKPDQASQPDEGSSLAVEVAAMRSALTSYRVRSLSVDSAYARPDQAPPAMTKNLRPMSRQRALSDSLRPRSSDNVSGDDVRISASRPVLESDRATISVTVHVRTTRGPSYETVSFVLRRRGTGWAVQQRTQLGIS